MGREEGGEPGYRKQAQMECWLSPLAQRWWWLWKQFGLGVSVTFANGSVCNRISVMEGLLCKAGTEIGK